MSYLDELDYIETNKSGFDYPSENLDVDSYETVRLWLDDFGWV